MNGKEALGCRQYIPCKYQIMSQAETHINLICKIFCFTQQELRDAADIFFRDDTDTHICRLSCIKSCSVRKGSQRW